MAPDLLKLTLVEHWPFAAGTPGVPVTRGSFPSSTETILSWMKPITSYLSTAHVPASASGSRQIVPYLDTCLVESLTGNSSIFPTRARRACQLVLLAPGWRQT